MRTSATEKVMICEKSNFFYIQRGVTRTPRGSKVEIIQCNNGIQTIYGSLKGTVTFGLKQRDTAQMIAYSLCEDDLILFAMEYDWNIVNIRQIESAHSSDQSQPHLNPTP